MLPDATNHSVLLHNDAISTTENLASATLNVLANDAVPNLIQHLTFTNPAHGSVQWTPAFLVTANAPSAQFIYTPTAGFYDYLAVGQTASDAFTYSVTDATGGVSTATVNVTINGTNDAPVIAAGALNPVTTISEVNGLNVPLENIDLLAGATDVDTGETATLQVANLTYTIDGFPTGVGGTQLPPELTLFGSTLMVDPASTAFDSLTPGQLQTIETAYDITDAQRAFVHQTHTITIIGIAN